MTEDDHRDNPSRGTMEPLDAENAAEGTMQVHINGVPWYYKIAVGALTVIAASLLVGLFTEWLSIREFRLGVAGNRFTDREGAALEHRIDMLEGRLLTQEKRPIPPPEVILRLNELRKDVDRLERR